MSPYLELCITIPWREKRKKLGIFHLRCSFSFFCYLLALSIPLSVTEALFLWLKIFPSSSSLVMTFNNPARKNWLSRSLSLSLSLFLFLPGRSSQTFVFLPLSAKNRLLLSLSPFSLSLSLSHTHTHSLSQMQVRGIKKDTEKNSSWCEKCHIGRETSCMGLFDRGKKGGKKLKKECVIMVLLAWEKELRASKERTKNTPQVWLDPRKAIHSPTPHSNSESFQLLCKQRTIKCRVWRESHSRTEHKVKKTWIR